jgi:protein tyrosine/serine phosphatase
VIENDIGDHGTAPHLAFIQESELTLDSVTGFMIEEYRRIPFEPRHLDLYRRYFRALAETDGAVIIHCAAGKDRTGLLAALTHKVLGVSDEDIFEDYLATNRFNRVEVRAPESQEIIQQSTGRRPSLEAVRAFLGVRPEYLETAFAEIKAGVGGVDAYLERALGVDQDLRARLRSRLIR